MSNSWNFYVSHLWGAIANLSHPFFPLVLFHLVWGDWVVATDEPREREKTTSSHRRKIQCQNLGNFFKNFSKVFSENSETGWAKKQAGSSRIMGRPFWKVSGLSHFFPIFKKTIPNFDKDLGSLTLTCIIKASEPWTPWNDPRRMDIHPFGSTENSPKGRSKLLIWNRLLQNWGSKPFHSPKWLTYLTYHSCAWSPLVGSCFCWLLLVVGFPLEAFRIRKLVKNIQSKNSEHIFEFQKYVRRCSEI